MAEKMRRKQSNGIQVGDRFGMLTVEEVLSVDAKKSTVTICRCRCDCGNIIDIYASNLKRRKLESCGCTKNDKYIGMRFGMLTIESRTDNYISKSGHTDSMWNCRCDCGGTVKVRMSYLRKGIATSCGCSSKLPWQNWLDLEEEDPLIGTKHGMLTILHRCYTQNIHGYNIASYECVCDCGNVKIVTHSNLKNTRSCGCLSLNNYIGKRFGRLVVQEKLKKYSVSGVPYTAWKCVCDCGNECIVADTQLSTGRTISCGCYQKECAAARLKKYNEYDLSGDHGVGYTFNTGPNGEKEFWFDLEDYPIIKDYCWHFNDGGYLQAKEPGGSGKHILMHRLFFPDSEQVDHIKHVNWDNRKSQLRPVTNGQNQMNKRLQKNNTSGYPGVYWRERSKSWEVWVTVNKKRIFVKGTKDFDVACKARDEAVKKYYGEYAYDYSMNM